MGEESSGGGAPADGWWLASDGNWYPPETHADAVGDATGRPRPGTGHDRAGASAAAEAQRLAELSERYAAKAANWERGADGERVTAAWLAHLPQTFVVLHDLHVPGSKANADHLVIGPTGVFVVDTKAYVGTYRDGDGTLWKGRFPIRREVETIEFIAGRVALHLEVEVHTILCFTEATLPRPVTQLGATRAVTVAALCHEITSGPDVHTYAMVGWLARLAGELVEPTEQPRLSDTPIEPPPRSGQPRSATRGSRSTNPSPRRSPQPSSRSARSNPRSTARRKKKGGVGPALVALAALIVGVIALPKIATAVGDAVADGAAATTTTAPASTVATFTCPAPGAGYTATFAYPPDGSGFRVYDVVAAFEGQELLRERLRPEPLASPELAGLWPGVQLSVTTVTKDPEPKFHEQVATVPAEPC